MTVLGPVPSDTLGCTSMHEHIYCDVSSYRLVETEAMAQNSGGDVAFDLSTRGLVNAEGFFLSKENCLLDDRDAMTQEIKEFREAGGRSVLELSSVGLRTNPEGIRDIASLVNVNVILGTGLYIRPSWPPFAVAMDEDVLEQFMVGEIETGIGETGVHAGHIGELGITSLDADDRRLLRAAARAAVRTGVTVTVHPGWEASSDGRAILPLLTSSGLGPERVIIAHSDFFFVEHDLRRLVLEHPHTWRLQTDYHRTLLDAGANISIDCFGHSWNIRESLGDRIGYRSTRRSRRAA